MQVIRTWTHWWLNLKISQFYLTFFQATQRIFTILLFFYNSSKTRKSAKLYFKSNFVMVARLGKIS